MAKQSKRRGREAWERLLEHVAKDEDATCFEGGEWSAKKLFALCCYLEQFLQAMHGHQAFSGGLVYVDLFAGAGVTTCQPAGKGKPKRYPGSALIAAAANPRKEFGRLVLVEREAEHLAACVRRVREIGFRGDVIDIAGDCNQMVSAIEQAIPPRSLGVCFVDPYSLDIHFSTLAQLAGKRALDLLILFADRYDIVRNVEKDYLPNKSDKLDLMLGSDSNWREHWHQMLNRSPENVSSLFVRIYERQLAGLGYSHCKSWTVSGPHGPMYRMVYASKNPLGLKFCEIALAEDFDGTVGLFGRQ